MQLVRGWEVSTLSHYLVVKSSPSCVGSLQQNRSRTANHILEPGGTITNSDLELTTSVSHHNVLAQQADVREVTIRNSSDNMATVWLQWKGATSTTVPAARLICLQALHQRHYHYVLMFDYITGPANVMADDCS
jgi:hypothetical protein